MSLTLWNCIAMVESGKFQGAMRFERFLFLDPPPWAKAQVARIQFCHGGPSKCDEDTALQIACTSYGFFQLLGANIYADGEFKDTIWDFTDCILTQDRSFARFIAPHGFDPDEDVSKWGDDRFLDFARFYNGPGKPDAYAEAMKRQLVT
jgi:hypothetical protein